MTEFFTALAEYEFLRYALATGLLASIACGVVGTYVVARRITYIAGGVAHCALGGMGAARYCQTVLGWEAFTPLLGALLAALVAALAIGLVSLRAKENEDTVIGALWAIGMAVGVLFISQTPGYNEDLMGYLFGNILMVSPGDLRLIVALDVVIVALVVCFHAQFQAVCFDEEFARLRGLRVDVYYLLLLALTALTVVLLVTVVGLVMVIALLVLPVAMAGRFARRLWQMMVLAVILGALFTSAGLAVSYGPDLPSGATIVVIAGAAYLLTITIGSFVTRCGLIRRSARQGVSRGK